MSDYRYAVGTFARTNIVGPQIVSGIEDASGTFPIAAVLLFTTFQTANGFAADARYSFGFSDVHQQCSVSAFTENDNAGTKFSRSHYSDLWALVANTSAQTVLTDEVRVTSLGTGSFTLNWGANDGVPWDVHYVVFGGADLRAKVVTAFSPASPGTQVVTGLGFQPTGLIVLDALSVGDASWGISTVALCPLPTLGLADGTNQGANAGDSSGFPSSTDSSRVQRTNAIDVCIRGTPPIRPQQADGRLVSLDADGFTINWVTPPTGTGAGGSLDPGIYVLAVGGPTVTAGAKLQGDASITGLTTPGLALFSTIGNVVSSVAVADQAWTFGAVDASANLASIFLGNTNGADPSVSVRDRATTTIPTAITPDIVPASSTVDAALLPVLGSSSIALTWSPNDAVARQVLYLAFERGAPNPPNPFPPGPTATIPMRKLRRSTTFSTDKLWNFFHRFQLDFQAGGPRAVNSAPIEICLRYSDDNGNTWSDELWQTVDNTGNYTAIAQWFQLGRGRDRVWEVSSSSDAMTVWLAAYLDFDPGTHG